MNSRGVSRRVTTALVAAAIAMPLASCSDGSGPKPPQEPTGRYELIMVGTKGLPFVWDSFMDGSYQELLSGSIRVLSRGRLEAEVFLHHYDNAGRLFEAIADTLVFEYRRSGEIVVLEFNDVLGTRTDTIEIDIYAEQPALRVLSINYFRAAPGKHPALMYNGLYVKQP